MPVPKGKGKVYGAIAGAMQNQGRTLEEAKGIADKAIKHKGVTDKQLSPIDKGPGKAQATHSKKKSSIKRSLKDQKH